MIKYFSLFLLVFVLASGCKDEPKQTDEAKSTKNRTQTKKADQGKTEPQNDVFVPIVLAGSWHCYKFEKDISEKAAYSKNYGVEFSKHASFFIRNDSIFLRDGDGRPIYDYWHSTKKKSYDNEGQFLLKFSPKEDSVNFVAQFNGSNVADPFALLFKHQKNLIIRDRGYFFFFRKGSRLVKSDIKLKGCPGDTRNYFSVVENSGFWDIGKAYKKFKEDFPYAAEDLVKDLPNAPFNGTIEEVEYVISKDLVQIDKNDENGVLKIEFRNIKVGMKMKYEIEYLEY